VWFVGHPGPGLAMLMAVFIGLGWIVWSSRALRTVETRSQTGTLWLYTLAMFAAYTFHSPSHWSFPRYCCVPVLLLMLTGLAGVARRVDLAGSRAARGGFAALGVLLVCFQAYQLEGFRETRLRPKQTSGFLQAWEELSPAIPHGARVGAFQAGVYGWFGGRPIVNLDGKVNSDAQQALARGRLYEYIASSDVEYLLDWQAVVHALFARHVPDGAGIGLRAVARQRGPTPVVLYRVERAQRAAGRGP
jgi:hypothetical protein